MTDTLTVGEAADLLGVTPKTLRHYEKIGLIKPGREDNGYRCYFPEDILRLQRIRQLQSLGLSLEQIKRLLNEHDNESLWSAALESLLGEIEAQMSALETRRLRIGELLEEGVPDPLEVPWPNAPRVQEYLEKHLSTQMWLQEQAVSSMLDQYRRTDDQTHLLAMAELIVALAQAPAAMPVGVATPVGWPDLSVAVSPFVTLPSSRVR